MLDKGLEVQARDAPPLMGMNDRPSGVADRAVERGREELDLHALPLVQRDVIEIRPQFGIGDHPA